MDPNSLLEQLRDVHAPTPPGLWPPAFGWWLLAFVVIVSIVFGVSALIRWRRRTAWRRQALREYRQLQANYLESAATSTLSEISALLKRCAASALDQTTLRSATGEAWARLLAKPENLLQQHEIDLLGDGHYRPDCPELDAASLKRIERWIRRLAP